MAQQDGDRPVRDDGLAPREVPFYAGQQYQGNLATRKDDLLDGGPGIGYVPGHDGTLRGSSLHAGGVHEASVASATAPSFGRLADSTGRRPMPREIPVHQIPAPRGTGVFTRYLDGHTEHHRERPGLLAYANHPETDPDEREGVLQQISAADSHWGHRFW